jgi:hypothetical protein
MSNKARLKRGLGNKDTGWRGCRGDLPIDALTMPTGPELFAIRLRDVGKSPTSISFSGLQDVISAACSTLDSC